MASKIGIVIEREYRSRVMKKSFILTTLLMPLLMLAVMTIPSILMIWGSEDDQVVALIDHTGQYGEVLQSTDTYKFVPANKTLDEYKAEGEDAGVSGVLEIRQDLREDPKALTLLSFKTLPAGIEKYINDQLSEHVTRQKLLSHEIDSIESIIADSQTDISAATYKLGEDGADVMTSGVLSEILGMVLAIVIYMFISMYGAAVMGSVMEEKKSRIMEVIISSVRPFDLMMGKILGVALVALTQVVIWSVLLVILSQGSMMFMSSLVEAEASSVASSGSFTAQDLAMVQGLISGLNFWEIGIFFILYFIGGFFLYASLYAALGSATSNDEDAQTVVLPLTMLMLISFYVGFACANAPDSTLAAVASYIPFTSPVVMMIRIPYGVSLWEELLSLAVLYGGFVLMVFLSARIYRVGVLMYGKKPTLKEIGKWMIRG